MKIILSNSSVFTNIPRLGEKSAHKIISYEYWIRKTENNCNENEIIAKKISIK